MTFLTRQAVALLAALYLIGVATGLLIALPYVTS